MKFRLVVVFILLSGCSYNSLEGYKVKPITAEKQETERTVVGVDSVISSIEALGYKIVPKSSYAGVEKINWLHDDATLNFFNVFVVERDRNRVLLLFLNPRGSVNFTEEDRERIRTVLVRLGINSENQKLTRVETKRLWKEINASLEYFGLSKVNKDLFEKTKTKNKDTDELK